MKTRLRLSLAAAFAIGLALSCPVSSTAQTAGPSVVVSVEGNSYNLSDQVQTGLGDKGDVFVLSAIADSSGNPLTGTLIGPPPDNALATINSVNVSGQTDPFVNFSIAVTNPLPGTDTFGLMINVPITACPPGSTVVASIAYTLTSGQSGVTISPVAPALFIGDPLVNGVSAGIPIGPTASLASGSLGFGFPTPGYNSSIVSGVAVNQLGFNLLFNLTGGVSQATISGRIECFAPTAVPEPGSLALLVGGSTPLGLLAVRRLRRRA